MNLCVDCIYCQLSCVHDSFWENYYGIDASKYRCVNDKCEKTCYVTGAKSRPMCMEINADGECKEFEMKDSLINIGTEDVKNKGSVTDRIKKES